MNTKKVSRKRQDPIKGITKGAIHKMAYQAGVKSISSESIIHLRNNIKTVLEDIILVATSILQHNRKKIITSKDIKKGIYAACGRKFAFDDEKVKVKNCESRKTKTDKKVKFKPGTVAIREIKHYQKSSDCVFIAKAPFKRLVYSITIDYIDSDKFKYSKQALIALQMFIENRFVDFIESVYLITLYCDRIRIDVSDIILAEKVCGVLCKHRI